jgi:hypothetical protein
MTLGGGAGGNRIHVRVTGDKSDLSRDLKGANKDIDEFGRKTDASLRKTSQRVQVGLAVAAAAGFKIARVAVDRAEAMNSAYAITEQIIKKTGGAANLTADQIKNLSREQSILTGIDKELITQSNNVLLTFKNLRDEVGEGNDVFSQASGLVLDMSTVMGTDAKSGAIQLGKALNDPITGISALTRVGITFTDVQKEQIRNFQESGDIMSAQKIILAELESQMGGTAEAAADDSEKIARAFDEISESIGGMLLPLLETVARELPRALGLISDLQAKAQLTGFEVGSIELAAGAINQLGHELAGSGDKGKRATKTLGDFRRGVAEILDESNLSVASLQRLGNNIDVLRDQFGLSAEQAEVLAGIIDNYLARAQADLHDEVLKARFAVEDATEATEDLGEETELTAEQIRELEDAAKAEAQALEDGIRALQRKQEALRRIHDPLFRIVRLQEGLAEAEQEVLDAEAEFGTGSTEFRDAVMNRALVISDLKDTLRDLRDDGIDPTGEAAARMLDGLGIPPDIIASIFAAFDEIEANLRNRDFGIQIDYTLDPTPTRTPTTPTGPNLEEAGLVRHRGGRVNAPAGQETLVRALGGEEINNPEIDGSNRGPTINLVQNFYRVEGDNITEDIQRGLLVAGISRYIEGAP